MAKTAPFQHLQHRNHLIRALSVSDHGLLQPHLRQVDMKLMTDLEIPNKPIKHVYFMESGFASVVAHSGGKDRIEVGLIGNEGMSGSTIVLGNHRSPHSTYIQCAGEAQRIGVDPLRKAIGVSASMQQLFLRFVQAFMIQTAHTTISNARSRIDKRLARWLLMAHDRIQTRRLPLTHEFLSLMLGVRRAGVTEALHILEGQRLVKADHKLIIILDRDGLMRLAATSYGTPEAEYRRLIG